MSSVAALYSYRARGSEFKTGAVQNPRLIPHRLCPILRKAIVPGRGVSDWLELVLPR